MNLTDQQQTQELALTTSSSFSSSVNAIDLQKNPFKLGNQIIYWSPLPKQFKQMSSEESMTTSANLSTIMSPVVDSTEVLLQHLKLQGLELNQWTTWEQLVRQALQESELGTKERKYLLDTHRSKLMTLLLTYMFTMRKDLTKQLHPNDCMDTSIWSWDDFFHFGHEAICWHHDLQHGEKAAERELKAIKLDEFLHGKIDCLERYLSHLIRIEEEYQKPLSSYGDDIVFRMIDNIHIPWIQYAMQKWFRNRVKSTVNVATYRDELSTIWGKYLAPMVPDEIKSLEEHSYKTSDAYTPATPVALRLSAALSAPRESNLRRKYRIIRNRQVEANPPHYSSTSREDRDYSEFPYRPQNDSRERGLISYHEDRMGSRQSHRMIVTSSRDDDSLHSSSKSYDHRPMNRRKRMRDNEEDEEEEGSYFQPEELDDHHRYSRNPFSSSTRYSSRTRDDYEQAPGNKKQRITVNGPSSLISSSQNIRFFPQEQQHNPFIAMAQEATKLSNLFQARMKTAPNKKNQAKDNITPQDLTSRTSTNSNANITFNANVSVSGKKKYPRRKKNNKNVSRNNIIDLTMDAPDVKREPVLDIDF